MAEKDIILVTGQSGVKVIECLKSLPKSREIISMERYIEETNNIPFLDFLGLDQTKQYEYWLKAFDKIFEEHFAEGVSSPVFLTFHATYYHQRKRELFSPVDFEALSKLKERVKMLVVFIDDIYDVYKRLMDKNQMFETILDMTKTQPLNAIYSSIFNIISLLNWREMEISLSRSLAKLLNIKLFIVSTKHPIFMIERLMDTPLDDLKIYYLSHPITGIRKESERVINSFVGKLEILIEKILKRADNIVLFFPTTIDELIIKGEKINEDEYHYYPELMPRWGHPYEDTLLSPDLPAQLEKVNPLNPLNYDLDRDGSEAIRHAISRLVSLLRDFIYTKQIISRDYSLVEQSSSGVIACRRNFQGRPTGGVNGELVYSFSLMKTQSQRKCFIFSCEEDRDKLLISNLFSEVDNNLSEPLEDLEGLVNNWIRESRKIISMDENEIQKELEKLLPANYDFTSHKSPGAWSGDEIQQKVERKKNVFKKIRHDILIDQISFELEKNPEIKERTCYEFYAEKDFWNEVYDYVDNKL